MLTVRERNHFCYFSNEAIWNKVSKTLKVKKALQVYYKDFLS